MKAVAMKAEKRVYLKVVKLDRLLASLLVVKRDEKRVVKRAVRMAEKKVE